MVQRRAARVVYNTYQPLAPVTNMVNSLGWETLETRRLRARLTMLYKIKNNLVAIPLPAIVTTPLRSTPIVKVLRDIWFKITQKHQIWHKCSLYHTISISDGRRDGRPPEWP